MDRFMAWETRGMDLVPDRLRWLLGTWVIVVVLLGMILLIPVALVGWLCSYSPLKRAGALLLCAVMLGGCASDQKT